MTHALAVQHDRSWRSPDPQAGRRRFLTYAIIGGAVAVASGFPTSADAQTAGGSNTSAPRPPRRTTGGGGRGGGSRDLGFDPERLAAIPRHVQAEIEAGKYDGMRLLVARHGQLVLDETLGFADRAANRRLEPDSVFTLMSVSKCLTGLTVLQRIERGQLQLTTPVSQVIPEFAQAGKGRITIGDLLTHTSGMPGGALPVPEGELGNLAAIVAATCKSVPAVTGRGEAISYSVWTGFAVLAEVVRRLDGGGRPFHQIIAEEVFQPLGMTDTSLNGRSDLSARRVPVVLRGELGLMTEGIRAAINGTDERSEIPSAGCISTGSDMLRLAEALRLGGALDGRRILAPGTIEFAAQVHTGDKPNDIISVPREAQALPKWPGNLGLGFFVRDRGIYPTMLGTFASPRAFGATGVGSTVFWVDPERDMSFVALTAGLMEQLESWVRFQRIADMTVAALVDPLAGTDRG